MTSRTTLIADADVLATQCGDETILLDLRDGVYYGLDGVGTRIWALLRDEISIASLRDAVAAEFDVTPAQCERDIRMLMRELAAKGLVKVQRQR